MRVFVLCFSESGASIWVSEKPLALASLWSHLIKFVIVIERDKDMYYVASVPELPGCHTQAGTLDELTVRVKEAIEVYLEAEGSKPREDVELVGFQFVEVSAK